MTTSTTPAPSSAAHTDLLTGADVLAIERAVTNVAYYGAPPDAVDRQALALATYWPGCKPLAAQTIRHIFDGCALPLNKRRAGVLLRMAWRLPNVTGLDEAIYNATTGYCWWIAEPCKHTDERPDLAHVPHSITVEPITPGWRRDMELPDDATLVAVERHHGRLAKVCNITDDHAAAYREWGYDVTIGDLARGIASTYGATYIEAPAVAL